MAMPGFDRAARFWRRLSFMARRCGTWLMVLALVVATGGHWAVLQGVAWAGMFVRYSQGGTVGEALSKTLDGQHPCKLCRLVRQGRAEERQKQDGTVITPKLDWIAFPDAVSLLLRVSVGRCMRPQVDDLPPERRASPPVPPPRPA